MAALEAPMATVINNIYTQFWGVTPPNRLRHICQPGGRKYLKMYLPFIWYFNDWSKKTYSLQYHKKVAWNNLFVRMLLVQKNRFELLSCWVSSLFNIQHVHKNLNKRWLLVANTEPEFVLVIYKFIWKVQHTWNTSSTFGFILPQKQELLQRLQLVEEKNLALKHKLFSLKSSSKLG